MAERPSDTQNWQKRQFISFGPHFRIDSGNPQMGLNGEMVYNLFAETDSGDSNIMGLQNGGNFQIFNDKSILVNLEKLASSNESNLKIRNAAMEVINIINKNTL